MKNYNKTIVKTKRLYDKTRSATKVAREMNVGLNTVYKRLREGEKRGLFEHQYINKNTGTKPTKICTKCEKVLTVENRRKGKEHICKECQNKRHYSYVKGYRARKVLKVTRGRKRFNLYGNKRARPNRCEMCGEQKQLGYHHWDDNNISKGMWICRRCHRIAEGCEIIVEKNKDLVTLYLKLKESINKTSQSPIKLQARGSI